MSARTANAHAKINLALAVTGVRDDGYHTLRSVFLRLELHDRLAVEPDAHAEIDTLAVDGELEASDDNLVLTAARQLRAALDPSLPALGFQLRKRIPAAAGLGGGSADAAAAIDLALAAWGVRLHPVERLAAAARIGADVPFFSAGHPAALVSGIGEHIVPLPAPQPPAGVVLITPHQRLSTADVFAEYDRTAEVDRDTGTGALDRVDEVAGLLRERVDGLTLAATTAALREANDLWAPALRLSPTLAAARAAAAEILGRAVLLTGSGPTLAALYPSEGAAIRAAVSLQAAGAPALDGAIIMTTSTSERGEDR